MTRIIIAVEESERSRDAVAFGGALARAIGAEVTVAHAYPWRHLGFVGSASVVAGPNDEAHRFMVEQSEQTLTKMSRPLRDLPGLETRSLADTSPARALQALAEELEAGLIVVGSSHGRLGRVMPGSTAERLLHGSPCPVAVVPHGYHSAERHSLKTIACGWDESAESEAALAAAEALTQATSASLRVVRAFEPTYYHYPPALGVGYAQILDEGRRHAERVLAERVTHLPAELEAKGELHDAQADRTLIEVSESVDLMVLGSRGYGPLRAVLLGGVSAKVARDAGCPVIFVPNGSHRLVAETLGANTEPAVA